jgi:TP901 family phage tail tape measure protein
MIGAYAAISLARKSLEKGVEFDYQTRFISALGSDRNPDAYKSVQAGLYGIKDAPADVNELAKALRVLQQTGVDAASGLGLLPTVISASVLGETTMKTATEDLVGVLEVFNLHAKNPTHLASNFKAAGDVMAFVAQETKANLHDVAAGLQGVTGVAEQYGVKLTTAAAAQAMLGKQGIVGQRAGTYSRSMFESLYVPTSGKAEKAFESLGFDMFDKKTGEVKDNLQGILELVEKIKKYDPKSQAKLIDTIFPTWGAKQFRAIFNDVEAFKVAVAEAGQQTGLLARQQEELSKSTKVQLQQLGAEYSNLLTKAFDDQSLAAPISELRKALSDGGLQNLLTSLVGGLVNLATWAANNVDSILNVAKALATWGVFQILSGTVGTLTRALSFLGPMVVTAASAMAGGGSAVAAFAAVATGAASSMIGALGPLTIAIGVAGAAWYLFRDRTNEALDESAKKVSTSTASMIKDLNAFNLVAGKLNANTVRARADAAYGSVERTWEELQKDRANVAKRYGLDLKDLTGDFDTGAMARKASSQYNVYPVLDALKKKNVEAAKERDAALGLLALAKKTEN